MTISQIMDFRNNKNKKKYVYFTVGTVVIAIMILMAIFAPLLTKYSYSSIDLFNINAAPSSAHILGTDNLGRDVFTRIVYGARVSLVVGIIATVIQIIIGVVLGIMAGYMGKAVDFAVMRVIDILMCFPFFIVAISIASILGPSLRNLIIIIAVLSWTEVARIVRAQTLSLKNRDFVHISKVIGFKNKYIIIKDILPNVIPSIIVAATISMANSILMEASLSFLGLGVKEPMPSWGNILTSAQNMRALQSYWWTWLPAGILIISSVLAINFIGEGFRIHFNPLEEKSDTEVKIKADLNLKSGKITALVGESGSGKTVTALSLVGLNEENISVGGRISFSGMNLLRRTKKEVESMRGSDIGVIFQEPMKSLNPVFRVGHQVEEMFKLHTDMNKKNRYDKVIDLFKEVKLKNPEEVYRKYPHEISGGMRQRVQIAMAISMKPEILIADEPTTAIDDSLKEDILKLLKRMCIEKNMALIFITHDLKRIEDFADEIAVMYMGEIVEKRNAKEFFKKQIHPYSRALVKSIPSKRNFKGRFYQIKGNVGIFGDKTVGCVYKDRCKYYEKNICDKEFEDLIDPKEDLYCRCHVFGRD